MAFPCAGGTACATSDSGGIWTAGEASDGSTAFWCAVFGVSAIGGPARRDCHRLTHRGASTAQAYCSATALKNHGSDHAAIVGFPGYARRLTLALIADPIGSTGTPLV